ncbi:MAG: DUF2752 domain-containing protein [Lachnospiraceae bacterium]|nr:DUF2752 domain-containing protein [Lachnospiraceae bacterium]
MKATLLTIAKDTFARLRDDFRKYWWLLFIFAAYYVMIHYFSAATCPIYQIIGLPCAGCGMSRATRFVLTGQFARAYYLNPLAFGIVFFAFYCGFHRYIRGKAIPYFIQGIILLFALLLIFYFVRMYLYFPGRVPYVYNYNNLMEDYFPGYRAFIRRLLNF